MTTDPEIKAGHHFSEANGFLKYRRHKLSETHDPEVIPGNTVSGSNWSRSHTRNILDYVRPAPNQIPCMFVHLNNDSNQLGMGFGYLFKQNHSLQSVPYICMANFMSRREHSPSHSQGCLRVLVRRTRQLLTIQIRAIGREILREQTISASKQASVACRISI